jgi:hypothetical protein
MRTTIALAAALLVAALPAAAQAQGGVIPIGEIRD